MPHCVNQYRDYVKPEGWSYFANVSILPAYAVLFRSAPVRALDSIGRVAQRVGRAIFPAKVA